MTPQDLLIKPFIPEDASPETVAALNEIIALVQRMQSNNDYFAELITRSESVSAAVDMAWPFASARDRLLLKHWASANSQLYPNRAITRKELADAFHLSVTHVGRILRRARQMNPVVYARALHCRRQRPKFVRARSALERYQALH